MAVQLNPDQNIDHHINTTPLFLKIKKETFIQRSWLVASTQHSQLLWILQTTLGGPSCDQRDVTGERDQNSTGTRNLANVLQLQSEGTKTQVHSWLPTPHSAMTRQALLSLVLFIFIKCAYLIRTAGQRGMISRVLGGHVLLWSLLDSPKNVSPVLLLHCNPTHSQIWTIKSSQPGSVWWRLRQDNL